MATFIQMMAKYPEVVKHAQAEIDCITGQERLPTLDDRRLLPVIDCIMREVFRYDFIFFLSQIQLLRLHLSRINAPLPLGKRD